MKLFSAITFPRSPSTLSIPWLSVQFYPEIFRVWVVREGDSIDANV